MNILYIDMGKTEVSTAIKIFKNLEGILGEDIVALPMQGYQLLLDVDINQLKEIRNMIDTAIKEKENGTNS